jgi:hypothetical protein
MKLSVVIPCFNEVDSIERIVQAVNIRRIRTKKSSLSTIVPSTGRGKN